MYDVDGNGVIGEDEMSTVVQTIYGLQQANPSLKVCWKSVKFWIFKVLKGAVYKPRRQVKGEGGCSNVYFTK